MSVMDTPTKFSFQGRVSHKVMNIINFTISVLKGQQEAHNR